MRSEFNEYKQELQHLQYSSEQKKQLATTSLYRAEFERKHAPKRHSKHRMTVPIVAAILVLIITAGAVGSWKSVAELFAPYFGTSKKQAEVMGVMGTALDESVTQNGVTLTANGIIGDKYNACMLYTLSWDKETSVELPDNLPADAWDTSNTELLFKDETPKFWNATIVQVSKEKRQIKFLLRLSSEQPVIQKEFTLHVRDIQLCWPDETGETQTHLVAKGNWELTTKTDYSDLSCKLKGDKTFELLDGHKATLNEAYLSPLGAYFVWTVPEASDYSHTFDITITKTDGTTVSMQYVGGTTAYQKKTARYISVFRSDTILPLDDMERVTVGKTTYTLSRD